MSGRSTTGATASGVHEETRQDRRSTGLRRTVSDLLSRRPTLVAAVVVLLGALALSATHVRHYSELSPVDELQHIDYLYKAPEVVRNGEKVEQDAMREQACRTLPNYPAPPCSETATYDPDDFQELGTNTAAIYTPLYYTLTKAVAMPLQAVTGMESLVTAARLVGGLWLGAGLVMTLLVARRLGAHPYPTAGLLLAGAATPNVVLPSATVTPDAAALLAGASLVWSVLWWEQRPGVRRLWLPALLALAVVALKALNVIVVVLVALYVVLRLVQRLAWPRDEAGEERPGRDVPGRRGPSVGQSAALVTVVSAVALAGAIGYVLFSSANAVASSEGVSMAERVRADTFPTLQTVEHIGVFLNVLYAPGWWVTTPFIGPVVQNLVGMVAFAGTFAAAFLTDRVPRTTRTLAVSLLVVGVVGAPLIITFSYVSQGMFVPIPGRYALTLVPAGLAIAAATLRSRAARLVVGLAGVTLYLAVLGWMLVP
ncbi:hypothetical protein [Cellulomonas telluris]|uniref:hypothetical protein n=1 Tax=Cellulomonas telluris TaxID=2306636 RepID=UPI0010A7A9B4|nr:hypothetical protein [Cellulomonas telluris]